MSDRERVAAEAEELYPAPRDPYTPHEAFQERAAYIRGRTVTAEQVEKAAWEYLHYTFTPNPSGASESEWSRARRIVATTLTAAGLLIEGGGR